MREKPLRQITKFLIKNADAIQKLATKHHKEFLGGTEVHNQSKDKYQKNHIRIVKEFARNIESKDFIKGTEIFNALGKVFAKDSFKDGLTLEEAVNGIIFLKQAIWEMFGKHKLVQLLSTEEFYQINKVISTYCDIVVSKIAFTYHNYYTQQTNEDKKEANETQQRLYKIFMEAPIPIAILKGPNHVYELSNPQNNIALGIGNPIGRPVKSLFPKAKDIIKLLDITYKTGKPFYAKEYPLKVNIPGKGAQTIFVNATYQPLKSANNKIEAVMATGVDVTEQVVARKQMEE